MIGHAFWCQSWPFQTISLYRFIGTGNLRETSLYDIFKEDGGTYWD